MSFEIDKSRELGPFSYTKHHLAPCQLTNEGRSTMPLKRNKSHGLGAMHLRNNKNESHATKIMDITPVVYSECVLKV